MRSNEYSELRADLKKLRAKKPIIFPMLGERNWDAPTDPGVYIIFDDTGAVQHVGSTPRGKNGIRNRLKDHMAGRSSFTGVHFRDQGKKASSLRGKYSYSYLVVEDTRRLALLESLAIGTLCPAHIGHGNNTRKRTPRVRRKA